jgi:photosystem II oxygen-evolving enhancer protein 3
LPPDQAAKRAKDAAEAIVGVKTLIDNKAWPYVQNGLRDYAGSLRYDLNTVIGSKPKEEKRALKAITAELYESLDKVRFAISVLHIYLSSFPCFSIIAVQAEIPNMLNWTLHSPI